MRLQKKSVTKTTIFLVAAVVTIIWLAGYYFNTERYFYSHILDQNVTPAIGAIGVLFWIVLAVLLSLVIQSSWRLAAVCFVLRLLTCAVMFVARYYDSVDSEWISAWFLGLDSNTYWIFLELPDVMFYYDRYVSMELVASPIGVSWLQHSGFSNSAMSIRADIVAGVVISLVYASLSYGLSRTMRTIQPCSKSDA
jgi:hypothetical protein